MKKYIGEEFLNKIYKDLFNSKIVKRTGKGGNKNEDVHAYMERLEESTKNSIVHNKTDLLKKLYYDKYIIKPENIPETYFEKLEKIELERGFGHVKFSEKEKQQKIEQIQAEQRESLDVWIEYFASKDTEIYPTWFKYFCFQGAIRLGYYDKKDEKFTKRTESTVNPFIELNSEAIAMVYDELLKVLNKQKINDKQLKQLLLNGSFSKIYAYFIRKINNKAKRNADINDGIWKKYHQQSDPNILFNDINGKNTGWCTAGSLEIARQHINGGDFYVYYTRDENNEYTCPRIAIRTDYGEIVEIRGIGLLQSLEPGMEKIIEKKQEEFNDKGKYIKKVNDMKMLTNIYEKWIENKNTELTKEEIMFIYEFNHEIEGFGYIKDSRIKEIIETRDKIKDYNTVFKDTEQYDGNLNMSNFKNGTGLKFPNIVNGNLNLSNLESVDKIKFPEIINGNFILNEIKSPLGLKLPKIMKSIELNGLTSINGIEFPEIVNGDLLLRNVKKIEDSKLPRIINGTLNLRDLLSIEGIEFPEIVNGDIILSSITSAKGMKFQERMKGALTLYSLIDTKGIEFPKEIGDFLDLNNLAIPKELKLPKVINGFLCLRKLETTDGLIIPDELECELVCPLANNDLNILKQMCKEKNKIKKI